MRRDFVQTGTLHYIHV